MALEIERKFLVKDPSFINEATSSRHIEQGYLSTDTNATVRVRIYDDKALITVKGKTDGIARSEWEYPIPLNDAREMLTLCHGIVIRKDRYIIPYNGFIWEVDVFTGKYDGLCVAEIELPSPDTPFPLPPFIGQEVSGDPRYYNSMLSRGVDFNDGSV